MPMYEYLCCPVITKHDNLEIKFPTGEYYVIFMCWGIWSVTINVTHEGWGATQKSFTM